MLIYFLSATGGGKQRECCWQIIPQEGSLLQIRPEVSSTSIEDWLKENANPVPVLRLFRVGEGIDNVTLIFNQKSRPSPAAESRYRRCLLERLANNFLEEKKKT